MSYAVGLFVLVALVYLYRRGKAEERRERAARPPIAGSRTAAYICRQCGYRGLPRRATRGSLLLEVLLWICFLVPGLIYSVWRLTTRYDACPACRGASMIPVDTPIGRKLAAETESRV